MKDWVGAFVYAKQAGTVGDHSQSQKTVDMRDTSLEMEVFSVFEIALNNSCKKHNGHAQAPERMSFRDDACSPALPRALVLFLTSCCISPPTSFEE